ncbi:MarR family winged helix-turn-helix transcriptional regulator [Arthrobacter sp. BF1]|uniref:MarR family winged helix-turn-helix transcriptional regulator n=1 Tax=Arthrobacter sp. BF1 TaxID=2821145 RepID=UPI001C4F33B7|nr:MarR family transcriptional regulator [Arthrobacter sp. BF1]
MSNREQQVGYVVKQAQSLLRLRMEEALHRYSLTVSQYSCLHHLLLEPGISAAGLARATFMTRQSMNSMLQQLLERGLVERPTRPESGRALPTALTLEGADLLVSAQAEVDRVEERMLSGLSPSELLSLTHGLNACVKALED